MSLPVIPDDSVSAPPPVDDTDTRKRRRVGEGPSANPALAGAAVTAAASASLEDETAPVALGPAVPQSMALLTNSALLEVGLYCGLLRCWRQHQHFRSAMTPTPDLPTSLLPAAALRAHHRRRITISTNTRTQRRPSCE